VEKSLAFVWGMVTFWFMGSVDALTDLEFRLGIQIWKLSA
jgi:hypothetical protein